MLMTARTHDLAAATAFGVLLMVYPVGDVRLATLIVAFIANQFGGIAPDIDQPTAPLWRNLPIGKFFGRLVGKGLGGHRFLTHSIVGLVLVGLLVKALLTFVNPLMPSVNINLVWWAFMVGMLSHLVLDSLTKEGVPWLLPLPFKFGFPPIRMLRITTGKSTEKVLFMTILAIDVWYLAANYNHLVIVAKQVLTRS
jgi:inner membrane protein